MTFIPLTFQCDQCKKTIVRQVVWLPERKYFGTVLLSMWCPHCKEPQVIRYQFNLEDRTASAAEHLVNSDFAPRQPTTGLTVSPRKNQRK